MKDWSDLEERYQDMRAEDATSAEDFKKQMTERFQKTVQVIQALKLYIIALKCNWLKCRAWNEKFKKK